MSSKKPAGLVVLPLLPLRDIIVFPRMVVPLFVGREKSIAAIDAALKGDKELFLAAQKRPRTNAPAPDDIFETGTIGTIHQFHRLPDGTVKVLVEGRRRGTVQRWHDHEPYFLCDVLPLDEVVRTGLEVDGLMRTVQSSFETYVKLNKRVPPEVLISVQTLDDPGRIADSVVAHLGSMKFNDRQALLEMTDAVARLEKLNEAMQAEIEILQVEKKIRSRVKRQMERTQKEYYLNEQMQAIQKELGERDEFKSEMQDFEDRLKKKRMSKDSAEKVRKEIKKLRMMQPMSAEATVVRNYLDWILALPWGEHSEDRLDVPEAERILEEDHYGLKSVKERVLEFLAVRALSDKPRSPVLCLVGPPGVGKTSLARSLARAMNRKFVRISLGGVRDEAEVRGHRRTYIGALPGKIIQSLKKAGTDNPVMLLDEVDKMSTDFRGDPAAALLEVLDPEQNTAFNDHYVDLDYDLSDVIFITTANTLGGIPLPLQDRMEVIQLSSYTEYEKLNIAVKYLMPRQLKECGLEGVKVELTDGAIRTVINHYTHEAGVRSLERELGSLVRKLARRVLKEGKGATFAVDARDVPGFLGVPKYRVGRKEEHDTIGLTAGLAVTSFGGDLLANEVTVVPGKGKLIVTGKLGSVMQESAQAAMSYVRSRSEVFGLPSDFYSKIDVHIHFPEGAIPKDGPSAGITMATSLVSALLKVPVRRDVAMTGEITLRGRVLEIGGLKEKLLAAHRGGITTVLIPRDNRKDLRDVPRRVLKALRVILVEHVDDVLREVLVWPEADERLGKRPRPMEYRDGAVVEDDDALGDRAPRRTPAEPARPVG